MYYVGGYKLPSAATHHQLRVDVVQEPAEVLALELFPELPPLCHAAAVGLRYVLVKRQVVKNLRQICVGCVKTSNLRQIVPSLRQIVSNLNQVCIKFQ